MFQLTNDSDFHFELVRDMGLAPYEGSDIGELLMAVAEISKSVKPHPLKEGGDKGDMEVFSQTFSDLARHVHDRANAINRKKHAVSARNAYFRAATYYRSADFYLHGNWSDPRINSIWKQHREVFDAALSLMDVPGKRFEVKSTDGSFTIPAIFYSNGGDDDEPSPTVILGNGYDGAQEELYHVFGKAALERGFNVITYDGPGQPTVRRQQELGFIPDWERVVTPVIDHALTMRQVDPAAISLLGYSLGGLLAARVAAFDRRVAAVVAIDGVFDFFQNTVQHLPSSLKAKLDAGDKAGFNAGMESLRPNLSTAVLWSMDQGLWSFRIDNLYDYFTALRSYTLEGLEGKVKVPVFVGSAQVDEFFFGQPEQAAKFLGDKATLHSFNTTDGAHLHCSVGASAYQNQVVFDWLENIFHKC